jgi:hypothetical protein
MLGADSVLGAIRDSEAATGCRSGGLTRLGCCCCRCCCCYLYAQVATENRRHKLSYHLTRQTPEEDAAVLQVSGGVCSSCVSAPERPTAALFLRELRQGSGRRTNCCKASLQPSLHACSVFCRTPCPDRRLSRLTKDTNRLELSPLPCCLC